MAIIYQFQVDTDINKDYGILQDLGKTLIPSPLKNWDIDALVAAVKEGGRYAAEAFQQLIDDIHNSYTTIQRIKAADPGVADRICKSDLFIRCANNG